MDSPEVVIFHPVVEGALYRRLSTSNVEPAAKPQTAKVAKNTREGRKEKLGISCEIMFRTGGLVSERPIDQIKKAEEAMRELVAAAIELRRQIAFACAEHPDETVELVRAAESFEREVQTIKERLQQWRQGIQ